MTRDEFDALVFLLFLPGYGLYLLIKELIRRPEQGGHPLAHDPNAESTRSDEPAFLTPPSGAFFPEAEVDGFKFGTITDSEAEASATEGDAFVVAPDGSHAGLIWEVSSEGYFEGSPLGGYDWGLWTLAANNWGMPQDQRVWPCVRS